MYRQLGIKILNQNLNSLRIETKFYKIINQDAIDYSSTAQIPFDLIFMDPPFDYPPLNTLIDILFKNKLLTANGMLIIEHEISNPIVFQKEKFDIIKQKRFGRSLISFIINFRGESE